MRLDHDFARVGFPAWRWWGGVRLSPEPAALLLVLLLVALPAAASAPREEGPGTVTGELVELWPDPPGGGGGLEPVIALRTDDGGLVTLDLDAGDAAAARLAIAEHRRVTVSGAWQASRGRALAVSALRLGPVIATAHAASRHRPWATLMCAFADIAAEPAPPEYFESMYAPGYPGLDHFWRELSGDQIDLEGSAAFGWLRLPRPRSYYVHGSPPWADLARLMNDCRAAAAAADVDLTAFAGVNMAFNAELDGYSWGGAMTTFLPPWAWQNLAATEHEMGHGFGLPHSSGTYGQVYDNVWDLMSDFWLCSPPDPTFGCLGQHTIAYHKAMLGWIGAAETVVVSPGQQVVVELERAEQARTGAVRLVKVPVSGCSSHFYTVEARQRWGYDGELPADAVIIHEVDTMRTERAHVIDADGNGDTGDGGAMWEPGETFTDAVNGISITVIAGTASSFTVAATNGGVTPPATERAALEALWTSTDGTNWINDSNWMGKPGTECTWFGVFCDGGHVTRLTLLGNSLSGPLPAELADLPALEDLHLSFNDLTGEIPVGLGQLSRLRSLHLDYNPFDAGPIPGWIAGLADLGVLGLAGTARTGLLPEWLGSLSTLTRLDLSDNRLEGGIPAALGQLAALRSLALAGNRLEGPLPPELFQLAGLRTLNLANNQLSGPIPEAVGNLSNLQSLFLGGNAFTGALPAALLGLSSLGSLDLSDNELGGALPDGLGQLTNLVTLRLARNHLGGGVPASLGELADLYELRFDGNALRGQLPPSLAELANLQPGGLDLRWNAVSTDDEALVAFLDASQDGGDWRGTQTIAPLSAGAIALTPTSVTVSWSPIGYAGDGGGYVVWHASPPGDTFAPIATTNDKTAASVVISSLAYGATHAFEVTAVTEPHAHNPNRIESDRTPAVLATTPPSPAGDADGDGVISVRDVFCLINYLFAGTVPPAGNADANGDGTVDVGDVFVVINTVFCGGAGRTEQEYTFIWLRGGAE